MFHLQKLLTQLNSSCFNKELAALPLEQHKFRSTERRLHHWTPLCIADETNCNTAVMPKAGASKTKRRLYISNLIIFHNMNIHNGKDCSYPFDFADEVSSRTSCSCGADHSQLLMYTSGALPGILIIFNDECCPYHVVHPLSYYWNHLRCWLGAARPTSPPV